MTSQGIHLRLKLSEMFLVRRGLGRLGHVWAILLLKGLEPHEKFRYFSGDIIGWVGGELEGCNRSMDTETLLSMLLDLAEELGIELRHVPSLPMSSDHPGAELVRLKGREMLFINASAAPADQIDGVASVLRSRSELEDRYLPPQLREVLDGE